MFLEKGPAKLDGGTCHKNSVKRVFLSSLLVLTSLSSFFVLFAPTIPAAQALNGNLYVSSWGTDEVKRYSASSGAFIDTFVSAGSGGLSQPGSLTFGPDGNLYAIGNLNDVKRYNGTTGVFIDTFISEGAATLSFNDLAFGPDGNLYINIATTYGPPEQIIRRYNGTTGELIDAVFTWTGLLKGGGLAFGPDGNLYVGGHVYTVTNSSQIKRYNGTTGAFIDAFVPLGSGGLFFPAKLVFGPDGNLYVTDRFKGEIKRYNGTTGVFIDNFVPAGSGGLSRPAGLTFALAHPPSEPKQVTLTVQSRDLSSDPLGKMWTTIRAMDGTLIKSGYTPLEFTGTASTQYRVSVANYDGITFHHWDDNSTGKSRVITLPPADTTNTTATTQTVVLTAYYDTGDTLRGFTPLVYAGGAGQKPDLTVKAISLDDGSRMLHMWTIVDPQPSTASGTATYKVYASNYKDRTFDHWEDGTIERVRMLTIKENTTITAYYNTS